MESWWWGQGRVEPIEVKPDSSSAKQQQSVPAAANQQNQVSAVSKHKVTTRLGRSVSVYRGKTGAIYATNTSKRKSTGKSATSLETEKPGAEEEGAAKTPPPPPPQTNTRRLQTVGTWAKFAFHVICQVLLAPLKLLTWRPLWLCGESPPQQDKGCCKEAKKTSVLGKANAVVVWVLEFWKHLLASASRKVIFDPAQKAYEATASSRPVQCLTKFIRYFVLLCQVVCLKVKNLAEDLSRYLGVVFLTRSVPEEYQLAFVMFAIFRLFLGTLYPAYASYKAVRTKNVREYVSIPSLPHLN